MKNALCYLIILTALQACNIQNIQPEHQESNSIIKSFDCFPRGDQSSFQIVTWNIERFPLSAVTPATIKSILDTMNVDIIAFQEVISHQNFTENVINLLPEWEFFYADVWDYFKIGFAYRPAEIVSIAPYELLYLGERNVFPRQPVFTTVEHISGLKINLINIHLMYGNDEFESRASASTLLKEYIDNNLSNEATILLGDFNDEINYSGNPFSNFINDSLDYQFADMDIALGDSQFWSYPPFQTHIDHILISKELFQLEIETRTLSLGDCISDYENNVSDHLPVMSSFILP